VPQSPTNETAKTEHKQQAEGVGSAVSWTTWLLLKTDARFLQYTTRLLSTQIRKWHTNYSFIASDFTQLSF
jgi:hypothetical protein